METTKSKICILGEGGVGKTSLISLLQGRKVEAERTPTVGLEIENTNQSNLEMAYLKAPFGLIPHDRHPPNPVIDRA